MRLALQRFDQSFPGIGGGIFDEICDYDGISAGQRSLLAGIPISILDIQLLEALPPNFRDS